MKTYLRFFLAGGGETMLPVDTASSSKCVRGCIIIEFTLCVVPSPKRKSIIGVWKTQGYPKHFKMTCVICLYRCKIVKIDIDLNYLKGFLLTDLYYLQQAL